MPQRTTICRGDNAPNGSVLRISGFEGKKLTCFYENLLQIGKFDSSFYSNRQVTNRMFNYPVQAFSADDQVNVFTDTTPAQFTATTARKDIPPVTVSAGHDTGKFFGCAGVYNATRDAIWCIYFCQPLLPERFQIFPVTDARVADNQFKFLGDRFHTFWSLLRSSLTAFPLWFLLLNCQST